VSCCKRQQRDIPSLLDGAGKAALVGGANAGKPAGHDLAALGHKALQQTDVAIRDGVNLFRAELADLLAAEKLAAAAGTTSSARRGRLVTFSLSCEVVMSFSPFLLGFPPFSLAAVGQLGS